MSIEDLLEIDFELLLPHAISLATHQYPAKAKAINISILSSKNRANTQGASIIHAIGCATS